MLNRNDLNVQTQTQHEKERAKCQKHRSEHRKTNLLPKLARHLVMRELVPGQNQQKTLSLIAQRLRGRCVPHEPTRT